LIKQLSQNVLNLIDEQEKDDKKPNVLQLCKTVISNYYKHFHSKADQKVNCNTLRQMSDESAGKKMRTMETVCSLLLKKLESLVICVLVTLMEHL
jgi:hypothetical protein